MSTPRPGRSSATARSRTARPSTARPRTARSSTTPRSSQTARDEADLDQADLDQAGLDQVVRAVEGAMTELFRLASSRRVHDERRRRSGTDLSRTEWELLRRVDDLGPVRVSRLAALVDLSQAVTSRALGSLESDGLVRRAATPGDGRGVSFRSTARGRRVRARFQATMLDELATVLRAWTSEDRAVLAEVLPRLVADLRSA